MSRELQIKFHALGKEKAKLEADLQPLVDQYEALRKEQQAIAAKIAPIKAELKERRNPIAAIDWERGAIARSLNGKTGSPE